MKENPFRSTIAGGEHFNSDRKTFGLEKSLPPVINLSPLQYTHHHHNNN